MEMVGWLGNCILEWTCQILPELQTKLSAINQIDHKLLLNRSRVGFGLARILLLGRYKG